MLTWNLFLFSDHVFQEHKRTVNRVCFHENEHKLLSGSQDGSIKLFVCIVLMQSLSVCKC